MGIRLRTLISCSLFLFLLLGCGTITNRTAYPVEAQKPELKVDVRVTQSADRSDTLHVTIERITRLSDHAAICLDSITQVVSTISPEQAEGAAQNDRSNYLVDLQPLTGGIPFCITDSQQLPTPQITAHQLTVAAESTYYPYDRVQFLHSITIVQANPARQIPLLVIYHVDIAQRAVEQIHALERGRNTNPAFAVVEIVLVRPWLYQVVVPIILGALLVCALLMMLIHERATFIQATIAMTVGTWNARQLILPLNDLRPIVLDQLLLCIYALIWVSFAIFTFRLQRKHI